MVGVNITFGRTVGFCFAAKATIPRSSVMASIRGEHSVQSGKSHYFGEIEAIRSFIEKAKRGDCKVFVIDELFSGTNTIEPRCCPSRTRVHMPERTWDYVIDLPVGEGGFVPVALSPDAD